MKGIFICIFFTYLFILSVPCEYSSSKEYSTPITQCNVVMLCCQTPERRSRARPGSLVLLTDPPPALSHKERSRTADCPKVLSTTATGLKAKGTCVRCVSVWDRQTHIFFV